MKFLNPEDYLNFGEDSAKDSEFEKKIKEYDEYFSTKIKSRLPEKFIKEYFSNHGFDDWKLTSIKADFFNGSTTVIVSLFDDFKNIKNPSYIIPSALLNQISIPNILNILRTMISE